MRKLRHYSFIDNTFTRRSIFRRGGEKEKYNLSTAAARKRTPDRGLPSHVALRSLHSRFAVEVKGEVGRGEDLFKGLRSWKEVFGKKKAKAKQ